MNEPINVPFIAFEGVASRLERANRRLWIAIILLIVLLVGSNVAWLIYESQYEEVTITQEAENDGGDIVMSGQGDFTINGQSEADGQDTP